MEGQEGANVRERPKDFDHQSELGVEGNEQGSDGRGG